MTRTERRDKVTEGAGGQIMENFVHFFGIYSEMGMRWDATG